MMDKPIHLVPVDHPNDDEFIHDMSARVRILARQVIQVLNAWPLLYFVVFSFFKECFIIKIFLDFYTQLYTLLFIRWLIFHLFVHPVTNILKK